MRLTRITTILGALGAMLALPAAALADPPAVGAPAIPPVFVGAPTNDNPSAGEFTVNFDSTGRYLGTGSAPDAPLAFDLKPDAAPAYRQARGNGPTASEKRATDRLFVSFTRELRDEAAPSVSMLGGR
jgi:hypothetical protein